jgi:hypothetical protein
MTSALGSTSLAGVDTLCVGPLEGWCLAVTQDPELEPGKAYGLLIANTRARLVGQ